MKKEDFYIGCEFYTATGKWRCTDVGTRVIVAIKLDKEYDSWYAGPPYAVKESVFGEYDFEGCETVEELTQKKSTSKRNKRTLKGLWSDLGIDITEKDIAEARVLEQLLA